MRYLNKKEFDKLNSEIAYNDLTVGMQITLDGTDEPGWYEVTGFHGFLITVEKIETVEELTENDIYDLILDYNIATDEELKLITGINGYNIETLNDVIYYKTGYHDISQYLESEGE